MLGQQCTGEGSGGGCSPWPWAGSEGRRGRRARWAWRELGRAMRNEARPDLAWAGFGWALGIWLRQAGSTEGGDAVNALGALTPSMQARGWRRTVPPTREAGLEEGRLGVHGSRGLGNGAKRARRRPRGTGTADRGSGVPGKNLATGSRAFAGARWDLAAGRRLARTWSDEEYEGDMVLATGSARLQ